MISFKNFANYTSMLIFKCILISLSQVNATVLSLIEKQQVTDHQTIELRFKMAEERQQEAYRTKKELEKEWRTVCKKQQIALMKQKISREKWSVVWKEWLATGRKNKEIRKKSEVENEKWQEEEEKRMMIWRKKLITWKNWRIAYKQLFIAQIQYEFIAVEILCETEGATHISNIIHGYLMDFNKKEINLFV